MRKVREYQAKHVAIQSDIRGDFNGTTLMFFSGQHVQRLSRVCLRMQTDETLEVNELQESLLLEISNIITGALVTQLANILKANIYGAPPTAPRGDIAANDAEPAARAAAAAAHFFGHHAVFRQGQHGGAAADAVF